VWVENYLGDKYAQRVAWAFVHRMLVPFGIRIYGAGAAFEPAGIDLAGAALIILGLIGVARALAHARRPDHRFLFAALQVANILFIARMKFVYHYHLEIVVLLMLPCVAAEIDRIESSGPALRRFILSGKAMAGSTEPHTAGNGSIMRLAPVPMFWRRDAEEAVRIGPAWEDARNPIVKVFNGERLDL